MGSPRTGKSRKPSHRGRQTKSSRPSHAKGKEPLAKQRQEVPSPFALLSVGHGSYVSPQKLVAVLNSNASPVKRLVHEAKKSKQLVDATHGRRNRSVLVMDSGHLLLSALNPDTLALRFDPQDHQEAAPHEIHRRKKRK